ncbi:hypothetical protein HanRHA438_Chr15g0697451 [Helianthus annuus]|nr:hypothetical protein HanIR_Chr15g0744661 [Helianthus annuus]KAJ0830604.1 hypothetical protein HanPSC8_Chr15g0657301 [Helianthus annuus]KAJ0843994.1 hypothetical protein HanRHA438_Chr15g0697451 [Helianthus annuus]
MNPDTWYVELRLVQAKFIPVAMGGPCVGTLPGLVHMLLKGELDPCVVLFRLLFVFSVISSIFVALLTDTVRVVYGR